MLVYTASLLLGPLPAMPFARGTREFVAALAAWGAVVALASLYVARGELRLRARTPAGDRLLAASLVTLPSGALVALGSLLRLCGLL